MIRRILTAYWVEYTKYSRLPFTFVGPVLVLLLILLAPLGHPLVQDGVSDYDFIAYALPMALNLIGFLMILVFSASLVSSEVSSGTIRLLLVRPLRRQELLAAKTLVGLTYVLLMSGTASVLVWVIAYGLGDLSGVEYGGELIYTGAEMQQVFLASLALSLLPQLAGVAFGIMISTFTRSTSTAIGLAVGSWLVLDFLKYPLRFSPVLFSSYLERPWSVFQDRSNALDTGFFPDAYWAIASSAGAILICLGIASFALSRKSLRP